MNARKSSNQINGGAHCFQHQCQTAPNISNGEGLKPDDLYTYISKSSNPTMAILQMVDSAAMSPLSDAQETYFCLTDSGSENLNHWSFATNPLSDGDSFIYTKAIITNYRRPSNIIVEEKL